VIAKPCMVRTVLIKLDLSKEQQQCILHLSSSRFHYYLFTGGQTRKYDRQGRQLDEEGKLANPEEAGDDDDDEDIEMSTSNVYECGNCGFTLFVAQGRESKFYGSGFKCPECGASKKDFIARDEDE